MLLLRIFTNRAEHTLTITQWGRIVCRCDSDRECYDVCIPCSNDISITVTPKNEGSSITNYYRCVCSCFLCSTFRFTETENLHTFTLTDKTYGLPIPSATLTFQT